MILHKINYNYTTDNYPKGEWSDKSGKWTNRLKKKLKYVDEDDGTFWMSFEDFVSHFQDVYICRIFDDPSSNAKIWEQAIVEGEWNDHTTGGCNNTNDFCKNPHYLLTIRKPCTVYISLSQVIYIFIHLIVFSVYIYIYILLFPPFFFKKK